MLQLETDLRTLCYCGKDHIETNHGLAKCKKELSQLKLTWKVNWNQKIQIGKVSGTKRYKLESELEPKDTNWKTIWNQKIQL